MNCSKLGTEFLHKEENEKKSFEPLESQMNSQQVINGAIWKQGENLTPPPPTNRLTLSQIKSCYSLPAPSAQFFIQGELDWGAHRR